MKSKTLISSIIVISIIVGLVIMFTSGSRNSAVPQQASASAGGEVENKQSSGMQTDIEQEGPIDEAVTIREPQRKVIKKAKVTKAQKQPEKQTAATTSSDRATGSRIIRVSRPGMKYRIVRVEKVTIPPESELRKWTRSQWVTKVSTLQKEGEDSLAQDYITAYNDQYPAKDLNNYLK